MKKFLKLLVTMLLILSMTAGVVFADTVAAPARYDAASEGIVSSYYSIDREKGFITGIAPGTSSQKLLSVCLPGNAVVSQQKLATGTTITATCIVSPPEEPSDTTEPTEAPTETTEPSEVPTETTEPTEAPTETTEPSEVPTESTEATEEPDETTEATEETTEESTESTEAAQEPTQAAENPPEARGGGSTVETKTYTLTVIVTGDLNGDANVTITDMLMVKSCILGDKLSETALAAGDLNYDGKVSITDFLKLKSCLLGLETISAGGAKADSADPIVLMTPASSTKWNPGFSGTASYVSDDETVAKIDSAGKITSLSGEGSTFVYALDKNGNVLARAMVTVLAEKLTISLNTSSCTLVKGQTTNLTPSFNHPVSPTVTWTSSDTKIVAVDAGGKLTAKNFGTAVVTATLANGSKAETKVKVVPQLTSIAFEKSLYKVKPGKTKELGLLLTPSDSGEEIIWTSSNTSVATVSNDGTVTGVKKGTVTITAKGKYSGLSASCKVKVCDVKQVAMTFDDGPSKYTTTLLDFLEENEIQVTFFMLGNRLSSYSNTVKRIAAGGHELGYHSYSHATQTSLTSEKIISDFELSNKTLKDLTGKEFTVWRSPGGAFSERTLGCIPLPHIYWSVDTRDWETRNVTAVYNAIMSKAKDGSIILLHDIHKTSVEGAIKAMKEMLAGDYEFVTVTEILSRDGTPPEASKNYKSG